MDDRNLDPSQGPDPSHDSWSAWLPQLDRPATDPNPSPTAPPPPPPPPPPPVTPAAPLPHAPAPAWPSPTVGYGRPPTHLGWAIVCTIICFMPFGIVAVIKAGQVTTKWVQHDPEGAHRASRSAKAWCLLAACVWPGSFLLFGCLGMLSGGGHLSFHM